VALSLILLHTSALPHIHAEGLLAILSLAAVMVAVTARFRSERR
jgi:hypothetical protein